MTVEDLGTLTSAIEELKGLPDPRQKEYYEDLSLRKIWLDGDIDEEAIFIVRQILLWNAEDELYMVPVEDRDPIRIYFNSCGGTLDEALSIAQVIKDSETPVYGINVGACCSGAALIYSQCHERYAQDTAYFLIHKGATGTNTSTYQQSRQFQAHYDYQIGLVMDMIYSAMGDNIAKEDFDRYADGEWYLYPNHAERDKNARELGLVTHNTLIFRA